MGKKFKDPENTAVFTTTFVMKERKDITLVYHDKEDGAWQFFSNDNFENLEDVAMIVGLGEIIEIDSSILEIADLPEGYYADRNSKKDSWRVKKIQIETLPKN